MDVFLDVLKDCYYQYKIFERLLRQSLLLKLFKMQCSAILHTGRSEIFQDNTEMTKNHPNQHREIRSHVRPKF